MTMTEQRLSRQGKFAWPIPEIVTIFIAAVSFVLFPEDEYFEINTFSGMILASAVISLPIGIPLLFAKVGFFWFDFAYVAAGVLAYRYILGLPDGAYIGEGLILLGGIACVISGCSHTLRRILASRFDKRRRSK
ncbi:hypothetical protein [Corynebacterium stationis]|uniref:Uncharacterized protein n=2 Tax=Corynebacteriaceae TaxID=1653 RepID=A0A177IN05_9CORY|nr:hypothetical protein [Corynebacterium stationis]NME90523.1 hypothetical protein [Corynebacterium stationis]NWO07438.1 hypothetical protein [Alteromonadaceae bacterium]OAH29946.1 hypothetical protein AYJ05_08950 [Corynebacterium stationis]